MRNAAPITRRASTRAPPRRLAGPRVSDALQDRVRAEATGQSFDALDCLSPRSLTMSVAPNSLASARRSVYLPGLDMADLAKAIVESDTRRAVCRVDPVTRCVRSGPIRRGEGGRAVLLGTESRTVVVDVSRGGRQDSWLGQCSGMTPEQRDGAAPAAV